jgi:hypothetical protein
MAGISEMSKRTFFWVNLTSGLIWAPLYLIPGILVGAAFNLEKEISSALIIIALVLALVLWLAIRQSRLLHKVMIKELQRSRNFAIVNAVLAWIVFGTLLIILSESQYFPHIQGVFQVVKSKVLYF